MTHHQQHLQTDYFTYYSQYDNLEGLEGYIHFVDFTFTHLLSQLKKYVSKYSQDELKLHCSTAQKTVQTYLHASIKIVGSCNCRTGKGKRTVNCLAIMMTVRKKGKVYIPTQEVQKWQQKFQKLELEEADKTLLKGLI